MDIADVRDAIRKHINSGKDVDYVLTLVAGLLKDYNTGLPHRYALATDIQKWMTLPRSQWVTGRRAGAPDIPWAEYWKCVKVKREKDEATMTRTLHFVYEARDYGGFVVVTRGNELVSIVPDR